MTAAPTAIADPDTFGPFTLRCYQKSIRASVATGWEKAFGQLMVAPTGSGKTCAGLVCCNDWLKAQDRLRGDTKSIVVWVAMRRELFKEAEKVCGEMGLDTSRFFFRSAFARDWDEFLGKPVILVPDESHHAACTTVVNLKIKLNPIALLGMSATPVRADQMVLGFQRTIFESNYNALIGAGYLSKYHHYQLPEWSPETVAAAISRDPDHWGKSAVFFRTRKDCTTFLECLDPGIRSGMVHGGANREATMAAFKAGELDVLANVRILTEGYDDPSMQTVFVDPSDSEVDCIQKSGRVMRLWNGSVKKVVQCAGFKSFADVAEPEVRHTWHNGDWHVTEDSAAALRDNMVNFNDLDFGIQKQYTDDDLKSLFGAA